MTTFEINVARNGKHFFATHERSLRTLSDAENVYEELCKRFPEDEGFLVTVSECKSETRLLMARAAKA